MTDDQKPDPPSMVMDRFIAYIPTLGKPKDEATVEQTRQQNDKLSQVIITVVDTLFVAPLQQGPNDESAALFSRSRAALAGIRTLWQVNEALLTFVSEKEAARHHGTPLYKVLLPRLIHAAVMAEQREDTGAMGEDLIATASDMLVVLERRHETGMQYVKGWTMARGAVRALKTFVQGGVQPHPATLYGYTPLAPSPIAAVICVQITITAQLSFLDDTLNTLSSAMSALAQVAHTTPTYLKALTAVVPHQSRGLEDGLCMTLQAHEDVADLLGVLGEDLAETAWWEIYDNRTGDVSPSKAVFLLTPQARIPRAVAREKLESAGLMEVWQHSPFPEVREAWSAFFMQQGTPRKRKREDVDDILKDVVEVGGDPLVAMQHVISNKARIPEIAKVFPKVIRKLCSGPQPAILDKRACQIWQAVCPDDLGLLAVIANNLDPHHMPTMLDLNMLDKLFARYRHPDRRIRMPAIRALAFIVGTSCRHPDYRRQTLVLDAVLKNLRSAITADSVITRAASMSLLGAIGAIIPEELTGEVLEMLLLQFEDKGPVKALAVSELLNLSRVRNVPITALFSSHTSRIAPLVGARLLESSPFVGSVMDFFATTRKDYVCLPENSAVIVASLVCEQRKAELGTVAGVLGTSVGLLLMDHAAWILARVFRLKEPRPVLDFMLDVYSRDSVEATVKSVMTTCTVKMVNLLVQDLGDRSESVQEEAGQALERAAQVHDDRTAKHRDVGTFLQPHILGVITTLNEDLHGARRKMTLEGKRRVLRALRNLIQMMGDSLAPTTPQLIASLQSSLSMPGLAEESLVTWHTFMEKLRYSNSGPFVGRTTAAVVANWSHFGAAERRQAVKLVEEIANNADQLKLHLDDVVDMGGIEDLAKSAKVLAEARQVRSFAEVVETLLDRTSSGNTAVATTALREFQTLLSTNSSDISRLVNGDSFDLLATKIVRGLMHATQEGDSTVRALAAACLGRLGLLDNDRLAKMMDTDQKIMLHNFHNQEEVADFACRFIRDVLVDSYKITNDIKYQGFLAYAMQELLAICGFGVGIIEGSKKFDAKVMERWKKLPKYQVEALSPLLHTRFKLSTEGPARVLDKPYYNHAGTYREWVQNWSIMLLQRICDFEPGSVAGHARQVFGVLRGVLRNQDVSVALYVLPHMVLHVLLSGDEFDRHAIALEINTVLRDQVNTAGSADKRALSAQVIFDLMDHLGKWLRQFRHMVDHDRQQKALQNRHLGNQPESRPHPHITTVERVLGSVDTELLANAALQSKAYARSLLNFEQRIIKVRGDKAKADPKNPPAPLYAYYERLHEIYADLDEPDGMEGVSMHVMSPSLEYQIREHESTGRWTSAQSCWEVRLQQSPDDLALHQGLLRCLRNLGHYDTLRTHIRGVLSKRPDWRTELAPFEAEAAWIVGDWDTVKSVADHGYPMAEVMSQLHAGNNPRAIREAFEKARNAAGNAITSTTYSRATEPILSLHILRELEMIYNASSATEAERNSAAPRAGENRQVIMSGIVNSLQKSLADRFDNTAPAFRIREAILSARRTAFGTVPTAAVQSEIGKAWIQSSKMARKAGYEQTAYSAALQAKEVDAPLAFVQQAKLTKLHGGVWKAHEELIKSLDPLIKQALVDGGTFDKNDKQKYDRQKSLAKVALLEAKWALEMDKFTPNDLIAKFLRPTHLITELESPYYHLGHYYDGVAAKTLPHQRATTSYFTCHYYLQALQYGNKYIYRTMPRTLTIWLDLGELKGTKAELKSWGVTLNLDKITGLMDHARRSLTAYQLFTAFPQIASRLGHKTPKIRQILVKLLGGVIAAYPRQAIWPMFGLMNSSRKERKDQCRDVMARVIAVKPQLSGIVADAERFSASLLRLADEPIPDKAKTLDLENFPYMRPIFPSQMMLPLQDLLTGTLPSNVEDMRSHNPFPMQAVTIKNLHNTIDVMSSLVKPKKLIFEGTDGKSYPFLCKPKDDLRKDARLMDFNAMINKLLKSASESRRRQLYIRTYAVMPLNELCGLIEWVSNTLPLKVILEDHYKRRNGKKLYTHDLHKRLEEAKTGGPQKQIETFENYILPHFQPCAFPDWFLVTWPEPASWLTARLSYARTLAVMSMIGYVLGLGDRHCENILFDSLSGDTVHVDLNCLFDKGKTFEIPERVPFRLTQNLVDAMGVTGIEGVFRKASEISMGILRDNAESLMSVLEAFVHDPLVEWAGRKSNHDVRSTADKHLGNITIKLRGTKADGELQTVNNQVELLCTQATSAANLAVMYQGWAPWL